MSDDNVVDLPVITKLNRLPERVLNAALESDLEDVVIIGYDKDGEFYFASSVADGAEANWLLDLAKKELLEIGSPDD